MKKVTTLTLIFAFFAATAIAQVSEDALRYSQIFYNGTARFTSMGGAFTALGGDISTLGQNPAGLGMFRISEFSLTPEVFRIKTNSLFNGTSNDDYIYDFDLGQAGVVINILNNPSESGLLSLNFGYSFGKSHNYIQSAAIKGISNNSSLADYFAERADGFYKDELSEERADAFLAWDTYLIDSLSGQNTLYGTVYSNYGDNPPSVYGQQVTRLISKTGYAGEHSFAIGGNYSDKLYFGASLSVTRINFSSIYNHQESTDEVLPSNFTDFNYTFQYTNTGTGIGLKMGAIFKPISILRVGVAFHSPTYYKIKEYANDNISTWFSDRATPYRSENNPYRFEYGLTTPFRVMAGAALQIKKLGLVSAEYEYVDYGSARFRETGDGYDYSTDNQNIKSDLTAAHNLRTGAELRLGKVYLRGGYALYGKPWQPGDVNESINYTSASLGAGIREKNIYIDFGYTNLKNDQTAILYEIEDDSPMSDLSITRNLFKVTFGYRFGE